VRGGRVCDVCATSRSLQQLQGHDRNGTGPRSGSASAVLCGPIRLSGLCVYDTRAGAIRQGSDSTPVVCGFTDRPQPQLLSSMLHAPCISGSIEQNMLHLKQLSLAAEPTGLSLQTEPIDCRSTPKQGCQSGRACVSEPPDSPEPAAGKFAISSQVVTAQEAPALVRPLVCLGVDPQKKNASQRHQRIRRLLASFAVLRWGPCSCFWCSWHQLIMRKIVLSRWVRMRTRVMAAGSHRNA
jgi:hypothetical protein